MCALSVIFVGCAGDASNQSTTHPVAASLLNPMTKPLTGPIMRRTVYVPVYSTVDWGTETMVNRLDLSATVSVRNVSLRYGLVLESVSYYDSSGKEIRKYVDTPSELPPLATTQFVVGQNDTVGGRGAKFLVRWAGPPEMNEPIIEAIMVGRAGNAAVSFTSSGRTLKDESPR